MTAGFIIGCGKKFLSRRYEWQDLVTEAYVFPEWQMIDVLEMAEKWKDKPTHLFAATFEDGAVTIGEKFYKVV